MDGQQARAPRGDLQPGPSRVPRRGCTCKDARIVSHRRAAFFSAWAKDHGETANRVVKADPTWSFLFNPLPAA